MVLDVELGGSVTPISGTRVLIVEDEAMLAMDLEDMVGQLGCCVVGRAARVNDGILKAKTLEYDVALLDLNLNGQRADDVALAVMSRRLPFIFVTGYGRDGISDQFSGIPVMCKPLTQPDLERALRTARGLL